MSDVSAGAGLTHGHSSGDRSAEPSNKARFRSDRWYRRAAANDSGEHAGKAELPRQDRRTREQCRQRHLNINGMFGFCSLTSRCALYVLVRRTRSYQEQRRRIFRSGQHVCFGDLVAGRDYTEACDMNLTNARPVKDSIVPKRGWLQFACSQASCSRRSHLPFRRECSDRNLQPPRC